MLIRATNNLAKALRIRTLAPAETAHDESRLGEWYGNIAETPFGTRIILMEARTKLAIVMPRVSAIELGHTLPRRLRRLLAAIAIPDDVAEAVIAELGTPLFTKTADRRLTGSLNEVCFQCANTELRNDVDDEKRCDDAELELAGLVHVKLPEKFPSNAAMKTLCPGGPGRERAETREVVVVTYGDEAFECRTLVHGEPLRCVGTIREEVPGELLTLRSTREWRAGGVTCIDAEIVARRRDVRQLGLTPLRLEDQGVWDPTKEYWRDNSEPAPEYAQAIIARGPRRAFEMERIDLDEAIDVLDREVYFDGDHRKRLARPIIMETLARDLRCLDAYARLGSLAGEFYPELALRHFSMGVAIGEMSLPPEFDGVLPWGFIGNRPLLRCLHLQATCLWRIGETEVAAGIFRNLLWRNPSDNTGARLDLDAIERGMGWEEAIARPHAPNGE